MAAVAVGRVAPAEAERGLDVLPVVVRVVRRERVAVIKNSALLPGKAGRIPLVFTGKYSVCIFAVGKRFPSLLFRFAPSGNFGIYHCITHSAARRPRTSSIRKIGETQLLADAQASEPKLFRN